jgi:hypothetical protein
MNLCHRSTPVAALCLGLALSAHASAGALALSATAKSSITVLGDSTIHQWSTKATRLAIGGSCSPGQPGALDAVGKGLLRALSFSAQVDSLKSSEGSGMDKNVHAAMDSDKYANVSFVMGSYKASDGQVSVLGVLSIHGVTRTADLKGALAAVGQGFSVKGRYDLLMSDFGVKPPVLLMGMLKVSDKVSIVYDFTMLPSP